MNIQGQLGLSGMVLFSTLTWGMKDFGKQNYPRRHLADEPGPDGSQRQSLKSCDSCTQACATSSRPTHSDGGDMSREPSRQHADFLQAVISSASNSEAQIFVLSSAPFQVVHTNAAWAKLCGTSAEAVGQPCGLLKGASAEPDELRQLQAGLRDRQPARVRLRSCSAAGVPFIGELTLMPLTDQVGDVSHFVGVLRRAGEEALQEQATPGSLLHGSTAAEKPLGRGAPLTTMAMGQLHEMDRSESGENSPRLPPSPGLSTDTLLAKDSFPMHNLHNHPIAPVLLRMLQARPACLPPAYAFPRRLGSPLLHSAAVPHINLRLGSPLLHSAAVSHIILPRRA